MSNFRNWNDYPLTSAEEAILMSLGPYSSGHESPLYAASQKRYS